MAKRCEKTGKKKYLDAGKAAGDLKPGVYRGLYLCMYCGFYHMTKRKQLRQRAGAR